MKSTTFQNHVLVRAMGSPGPKYPQGSQDQADFALDEVVELETVNCRLLWPDTRPENANEETNATTDPITRSSSIVFDFSQESPTKDNVPLAQSEPPPVTLAKVADKKSMYYTL
ncbi:hypothetical protein DFH28DRAFT_928772 [Melampsora americana]|nr:hypothetical protein DFH28DRAFT_928772 [Melampsora americana]